MYTSSPNQIFSVSQEIFDVFFGPLGKTSVIQSLEFQHMKDVFVLVFNFVSP